MAAADFDLRALFEAIDARRRERGMSWTEVAAEVNRHRTTRRPIAASTITGLRDKPSGEGDGILQMLLWLGRPPESFVIGRAAASDFPRVMRLVQWLNRPAAEFTRIADW